MRIRYIVIGLASLFILLILAANHNLNINHTTTPVPEEVNASRDIASAGKKFYPTPLKSGSVSILPWEKDEAFQKALDENHACTQMANYCTVLKDPIPGEETNVHIAARLLKGTVVKPGEVFSQNARVGPYNAAKGFQLGPVYIGSQLKTTIGGGVCKVASTLYNVAVLANLPVVERYAHSMPVPYVPLGQDATVCYGVKDLKFLNNTPYPILVWAEGVDNRLYVGLYGQTFPPQVEWHHQTIKKIRTYRIYTAGYGLESGSEKVIVKGMDGAIVRSWLTIKDGKGKVTKNLGRDYYNPMPYIIEKGMMNAKPAS